MLIIYIYIYIYLCMYEKAMRKWKEQNRRNKVKGSKEETR
jgi:hypothetical protein